MVTVGRRGWGRGAVGRGRWCVRGARGCWRGWGHARGRVVRGWRGGGTAPRRARCTGCGVTHVLLPVLVLVRRADAAAVIGAALAGEGGRCGASADRCGAGPSGGDGAGLVAPVRRAGRGGAGGVHLVLSGVGRGSGAARRRPGQRLGGRAGGDRGAAAAAARRFGLGALAVSRGRWPSAVSAGRLLAPGWRGLAGDQHELPLVTRGRGSATLCPMISRPYRRRCRLMAGREERRGQS